MNAEQKKRSSWKIIVGVLLLVLAAFAVGRLTATQEADDHDRPEAEETEERVRLYTCSMHPQVRKEDPNARCPICGMELIPVTDDDEPDDDTEIPRLRVSERAAALMDIHTRPAERRAVTVEVRLFGKLEFDETRIRDVVARADSYIEELHADYTWHPVERGDVLAELYSPMVVAAMRELLVARGAGGDTLESAKARLERLGVSTEQIEEVLDTGDVPRTYRVISPVDGVVAVLDEREGRWLGEGTRLMRLVDTSRMWARLEAFETDLAWLKVGQPVQVTVAAHPGDHFEGEITYIDPIVDDRTRAAGVRAEFPNPDGTLKAGMFVNGAVQAEPEEAEPLVVPESAPLITGRRALVYVKIPGEDRPTFEPRAVTLGPRAGDFYIIRDGLEENDLVVVHGQFKIDSELQIRGRPSMMAPEGEPPPVHDHGVHEEGLEVVGFRLSEEGVDEEFSRQIASLLESYLTLSDAMADDDFEESMESLRVMHNRLLEVDGDLLEGAARAAWEEIEAALHHPQHEMMENEDLEEFRKSFELLTHAMIRAAETFGGEAVGEVYVIHCPMAFDFEGADWLQKDREIRNPYFGEAMLRCGEVRRRF